MVIQKEKTKIETVLSEKLEALKQARQNFSSNIYENLDRGNKQYNRSRMNAKDMQAMKGNLSKLDEGLQHYKEAYKSTVADIADGLNESVQGYLDFAKKIGTYQGLEVLVRLFSHKKADRMRHGRLQNQNPADNLKLIIDYSHSLVKELLDVRKEVEQTYDELVLSTDIVVEKIKVYEPVEAELKEKLTAMETEYQSLDEQIATASADKAAQLESQKNDLHKELTVVRVEYDKALTTYKQAQDALKSNEISRDQFLQMVRDVGMQATMIKEKVDNITPIYLAAASAIKAMLKTKGMEKTDQALNAGTKESLEMIVKSGEGVTDATTARAKKRVVAEEELRQYLDRTADVISDFATVLVELSNDARRSQAERYSSSN